MYFALVGRIGNHNQLFNDVVANAVRLLTQIQGILVQDGSHDATRQHDVRSLHAEDDGHRQGRAEDHGVGRIDDGGFPQRHAGCADKSDGRGVDALQNGLERFDVSQTGPERDHAEDEDDTGSEQSDVGDESAGYALVDGTEVGREVEERSRHGLGQSETLQELILRHPLGYDLVLQHGKDDLSTAKDDGTDAVHGLEDFEVLVLHLEDVYEDDASNEHEQPGEEVHRSGR
mmetsp:Transcript_7888/g.21312  ORF Transcript_7888/g.21312 Transcript_7888/m.21312 type:complete len:231 (-) Transcript_7888:460-1152(-)